MMDAGPLGPCGFARFARPLENGTTVVIVRALLIAGDATERKEHASPKVLDAQG